MTAHERGAQLLASGEWADGRRWGADNPRERLHEATIAPLSLMAGGAAGAFVHGLEDEFLGINMFNFFDFVFLLYFHCY